MTVNVRDKDKDRLAAIREAYIANGYRTSRISYDQVTGWYSFDYEVAE